jgi:triosephosphate isomerase
MIYMIQKILVANWKMNPQTLREARQLALEIKKISKAFGETKIIVSPPAIYLSEIAKIISKTTVGLGAQDVSSEKEGAQTGENSAGMLKDCGVGSSIVGHSERRAKGETDDVINKKVLAVTTLGMTAILCVGERLRDEDGQYLELLRDQLISGVRGLQIKSIKSVMIAYEPVWAIGVGAKRAMLGTELHEISIFIRKTLLDLYGKSVAYKIPILYGGSVDEKNASDLLMKGVVDGFLVGRSSLDAETFKKLLIISNTTSALKIAKL